MGLYTKKGDSGETFIFRWKKKLYKSDNVFELLGTLDAVNSWLSFAAVQVPNKRLKRVIRSIQGLILSIGAEINLGKVEKNLEVDKKDTQLLEALINFFESKTPALKNFILPGQSLAGASLHICRCSVRDAERLAVGLKERLKIRDEILAFLNRLSDCLFAMARYVDLVLLKKEEIIWKLQNSKIDFSASVKTILKN